MPAGCTHRANLLRTSSAEVPSVKASTSISLAIALLIGLAAAAGAKYAGFFDKKTALPTATEKATPTKVLVSRTNLFEEVAVTSAQVSVRDLTADEEKSLSQRVGKNWKE